MGGTLTLARSLREALWVDPESVQASDQSSKESSDPRPIGSRLAKGSAC